MNSLLKETALLNAIFTIRLEEIDLVNSLVSYYRDLQCHFRGEGGLMQSVLYSDVCILLSEIVSL